MFEKFRKSREDEEIQFKVHKEPAIEEFEREPEVEPELETEKKSSIEGNNIELKVVRPESMEEIFVIADYLLDGCTVVLNLELIDRDSITRMLDFLNGVTYTTGGDVKNVSQGTYIITPNGINVEK